MTDTFPMPPPELGLCVDDLLARSGPPMDTTLHLWYRYIMIVRHVKLEHTDIAMDWLILYDKWLTARHYTRIVCGSNI